MAYERVTGPIAHRRGDIQAATVASVVANSQKSKRSKKAKLSDFLIDFDKRRGRSSGPHELLAKLRSATRRMGGSVGEKGGSGGDD